MALSLIDRFTGEFDPKRYEDTYRERLLDVIRRKRRGEAIEAPTVEEEAEAPTDLLAALRQSVEQAKRGRAGGRNGRRNGGRDGHKQGSPLDGLSVAELGERARKLGIEGRSKMSKRELARALARKQ